MLILSKMVLPFYWQFGVTKHKATYRGYNFSVCPRGEGQKYNLSLGLGEKRRKKEKGMGKGKRKGGGGEGKGEGNPQVILNVM